MLAGIAQFVVNRLTGRARRRGMQLLFEHLTPVQRDQLMRSGHFDITGGTTRSAYRIHNRRMVNVEVLQDGQAIKLLCFQPMGGLVQGDVLLAQKLALELFESETLSVANRHLVALPERRSTIWG
jgi:hypothetical protein